MTTFAGDREATSFSFNVVTPPGNNNYDVIYIISGCGLRSKILRHFVPVVDFKHPPNQNPGYATVGDLKLMIVYQLALACAGATVGVACCLGKDVTSFSHSN